MSTTTHAVHLFLCRLQSLFWEFGTTIVTVNNLLHLQSGMQELFANATAVASLAPHLHELFRAVQQTPQRVSAVPMPTPAVHYNSFYSRAARLFAFLFAFTFLFPATRMLRDIVVEKEEKLREGMRIMGLTSAELMSSWYITYVSIVFIQCVPIAFITKALVFKVSSDTVFNYHNAVKGYCYDN